MTFALADDEVYIAAEAADDILALAQDATVVALGPGLGRSPELTKLVARLYREIERPLVVDADGLFALAESPGILERAAGLRVLTPHLGEFVRFTRQPPTEARRVEAAAHLADRDSRRGTIVLLKGHQTIITDGQRFALNRTGNPGMATGGSGDVLTGIITGLMCQGLEPFDAARLGAYIHGSAGDMAAENMGQISLIATDLIDHLPAAFQYFIHHQRKL
jgi:NAD(P)H-hydrate epimerase